MWKLYEIFKILQIPKRIVSVEFIGGNTLCLLKPICCKKRQKIVPDSFEDSKLILNESLRYSHNHLGSVWYHSEPSEGPYFPNQ